MTKGLGPTASLSNGVLRKHAGAVHTSGELGLLERKLNNVLLLNAYDDLLQPRQHSIPVLWLFHLLGREQSRNLANLKTALTNLQKTIVEFNIMRDGKEHWESMALLSFTSITGTLDHGVCNYRYAPELAEKLHDPDVYAAINLSVQRSFKGGYSLTLYENAVRYKNVKSTGWWDIPKFRALMGADADTYDDFKHLNNFVIKKAVTEINKVSDIQLTVEYERVGRKVVRVRFIVEQNPQISLFDASFLGEEELSAIRQSPSFQKLLKHGISDKNAVSWIRNDPEHVQLAIETAERRDKKGLIKNSAGAYITALVQRGADLMSRPSAARKKIESAAAEKQKARDQRRHDELRNEFSTAATTDAFKNSALLKSKNTPTHLLQMAGSNVRRSM